MTFPSPDNPNTDTPSFHTTYRRADRELIADYGWVTDIDVFDDDEYPVELVEEKWERTSVRTFWLKPTAYSCEIEDGEGEPCEEDAVDWWREPAEGDKATWMQVCADHKRTLEAEHD